MLDRDTHLPVPGSYVKLSARTQTPFVANEKTGRYVSWPLPPGGGLVTVTAHAPGYAPAERATEKGKPGEVVTVDLALEPEGRAQEGEIKGSLKDAKTGLPLRGVILIPQLDKKVRSRRDGTFRAVVPAGRYQIVVHSQRYETQKSELVVGARTVIILNIDLARARPATRN